jgi:hypothetical protein|tara:strand:+ start:872 stop:1156 length:285 start_codon:yes stop_codon:yes gene_type:complete
MTDSSSNGESPEVAAMAGELFQAKIDAARSPQTMTHLLQLGSFRMEIVPDRSIDIEQVFKDTIADLHEKFGSDVLKINMTDIIKQQPPTGGMHG